ncbi:hypothetical protein SE336_16110 [Xanthomonas arboricola]|uniref:hypothetical protein n=1 Tax=Xanthomonas arboricola TaxID=56448 RepID=UPI0039F5C0C1
METIRWALLRCWPLSEQCAVDWGAWAVGVAVLALGVACLTVLVTAASAVAVYLLGREANRLAVATQTVATEERQREARFLLAYLNAELLAAHATVKGWVLKIEVFRDFFLMCGANERKAMLSVVDVDLPAARELRGRLHVLDKAVADRLARVLSTIDLLRTARRYLMILTDDEDNQTKILAIVAYYLQLAKDLEYLLAVSQATLQIDREDH